MVGALGSGFRLWNMICKSLGHARTNSQEKAVSYVTGDAAGKAAVFGTSDG